MAPLTISIEQFTADRLEGRCTEWGSLPRPGSFIQFTTASGGQFYAQVVSVRYMAGESQGLMLGMRPVAGMPDSRIESAHQVSQAEYFAVAHGHHTLKIPFRTPDLTLDLADSGKVVYVKPSSEGIHKAILGSLQKAELPVVIIDPVGLDLGSLPAKELAFGPKGLQLSIQDVGVSQFIQWVVNTLPVSAQPKASEELLKTIPPTADFIPLQYFVDHPALQASPLSAAILHPLYHFHQHHLFASKSKQALDLDKISGVHHLNLSTLPAELLSIGYEGVLRSLYRSGLPANTQVVLVAPEVAPEFVRTFTQHTRNRVILMSTLLAPWQDLVTDSWNEVRLFGEEGIEIKGDVAHGLTLFTSTQVFSPATASPQIPTTTQAPTERPIAPVVEAVTEASPLVTAPPEIVIPPLELPAEAVPVPVASAMPELKAPSIEPVMSQVLDSLQPVLWEEITDTFPELEAEIIEPEPEMAVEIPEPSEADEMAMLAASAHADLALPDLETLPEEPFMPETEAETQAPETPVVETMPEIPLNKSPEVNHTVEHTDFLSAPPMVEEAPVEESALMTLPEMNDDIESPLETALDTSLAAPFAGLDFLFEEPSTTPVTAPAENTSALASPSEPAITETTAANDENSWALDALSVLEETSSDDITLPDFEEETPTSEDEFVIDNGGLDLDFDLDAFMTEIPSPEASQAETLTEIPNDFEMEASPHLSSLMNQAAAHEEQGDPSALPEIELGTMDLNTDLDASLVSDPNLELDTQDLDMDLPNLDELGWEEETTLTPPTQSTQTAKPEATPMSTAARADNDETNLDALSALDMLNTLEPTAEESLSAEMDLPMVFDLDQPVLTDTSLPPSASETQSSLAHNSLLSVEAAPTLPPPDLSLDSNMELSLDLDDDVFAFESDTEEMSSPAVESHEPASPEALIPELDFDFDTLDTPSELRSEPTPQPQDTPDAAETLALDMDLDFDFPDFPTAAAPPEGLQTPEPEANMPALTAGDVFGMLDELDTEVKETPPSPETETTPAPMAAGDVFGMLDELDTEVSETPPSSEAEESPAPMAAGDVFGMLEELDAEVKETPPSPEPATTPAPMAAGDVFGILDELDTEVLETPPSSEAEATPAPMAAGDVFGMLEELDAEAPETPPSPEAEESPAPMAAGDVFGILGELDLEMDIPEITTLSGVPSLPEAAAASAVVEEVQTPELNDVFSDLDDISLGDDTPVTAENLFPSFETPEESAQVAISLEEIEALENALDEQLGLLNPPAAEPADTLKLETLDFDLEIGTDPMPLQTAPTLDLEEPEPPPQKIAPVFPDLMEQEDLLAMLDEPPIPMAEPEIPWEEEGEISMDLDFDLPEPISAEVPAPLTPSVRPTAASENSDWDLDFDLDLPEAPIGTDGANEDNLLPDFTWDDLPIETSDTPEAAEEAIPIYKNLVENETPGDFEAGQQVMHQRYGTGVIKRVIVMNDDQIILNVVFDSVGKRLLDPKLTQLEKVG